MKGASVLSGVLLAGLVLSRATLAAPEPAPSGVMRLAVPPTGAYTGAYLDFGDYEDEVTLEKITAFNALVGKTQAIIGFSNFWGRQRFPTAQARIIANAGAVSLIYWNPWNDRDEARYSRFDIDAILSGRWDAYIDAWAAEARAFGKPLLVAWGLEMNGDWFPWSGVYHGADEPIPGSDPPRYRGPETFKRAYRHIVDRVRAAGADNIAWVFHTNNTAAPDVPWNRMAAYYPGDDYVDWLAMSAYGKQTSGEGWAGVKEAILDHYDELAALAPDKPILLGEWGIGEFPHQGDKGRWISEAMTAMERLPRLKGAVFWHERWQNPDLSYSNLRVNSSLGALEAYRRAVARDFWLGAPRFEPLPASGASAAPAATFKRHAN